MKAVYGSRRFAARFVRNFGVGGWWTLAGAVVTLVWLVGVVPAELDTRALVVATATAAVVTATWAPRTDAVEWLFASGLALVLLPTAAALVVDRYPGGSLLGLAAVVAGGFPVAPRLARPLLVVGVALAVPAATGATVAAAAAAGAVLVAMWSGAFALPLALVAVAAAPVAPVGALLLAAAAALAAADDDQGGAVAVLALPGAIAAAAAIAAGPVSAERVAATVALAAVAYLATTHAPARTLALPTAPAAALAAWLVVAPATWTWAGDTRLGHYDRGVAIAAAVVVGAEVVRRIRPGPVPSDPELP
ncbi:MAG TPA: hypothetical protein VM938_12940 [Acidimicrobiales bacterium]|nr:hypothetical protein [Acidimicrobiales bacterium]